MLVSSMTAHDRPPQTWKKEALSASPDTKANEKPMKPTRPRQTITQSPRVQSGNKAYCMRCASTTPPPPGFQTYGTDNDNENKKGIPFDGKRKTASTTKQPLYDTLRATQSSRVYQPGYTRFFLVCSNSFTAGVQPSNNRIACGAFHDRPPPNFPRT